MKSFYKVTLLLVFYFIIGCQPNDRLSSIEVEEVFLPDKIDDGKPEIPGNYFEIANRKDLNLHQKCLIEGLSRFEKTYSTPPGLGNIFSTFYGLGITNLNPLIGIEAPKVYYAVFHSTRLNNIDGLVGYIDLQEIVIRGSNLEDLSVFAKFKKLKKLDIAYSSSKDLSSLKDCVNLEQLTIDEESNYSLDPIKNLLKAHLNNDGKMIKLNVKNVVGKFNSNRKTVKGLVGKFNLTYLTTHFSDGTAEGYSGLGANVGSLIFTSNTYELKYLNPKNKLEEIIELGTYSSIGNLIYFTEQNGNNYVNYFVWEGGDNLNLIDKEREEGIFNTFFIFELNN